MITPKYAKMTETLTVWLRKIKNTFLGWFCEIAVRFSCRSRLTDRNNKRKKEVHRTPLIWRLQALVQGITVGGLLSVSPPEEHHERTCDSGSAIDS
jgi:hypothetical protein